MMEVGSLPDEFRTKILELNKQNFIHILQQNLQIKDIQLAYSRTFDGEMYSLYRSARVS